MKTAPQDQNLKEFQSKGVITSKSQKEYGQQLVSEIADIFKSSYFKGRNERFALNESMATGKMNFNEIKQLLDRDQQNKKDYSKIIWKGIMIANTIISRLVGRWMQAREKVIVKGVDMISNDKRQQAESTAEFYLEYKNELQATQQMSGVQMIPQNQFVPDDKDHLDLWTKYELRLPEEYIYGKEINSVLTDQGFGLSGVNRRKLKWDAAVKGFVGTYTYADKNGKIHVERVIPQNSFYSYSTYDDFRDVELMGQVVSKKISEVREMFPDLSEKDLYDNIVVAATKYNKDDKLGRWNTDWFSCYSRPYDGWNVDIAMFELKTLDTEVTTMKVTANGNLLIQKGDGKKLNGSVTKDSKDVWNIYEGFFVKSNNFLLKWALKENPVKPQDLAMSSYSNFSYSFYMYQNVEMRNLAVPEKIEEPIIQMLIARFKIQELVAGMRKAGLLIDITGTTDIDLGTGEGKLNQMQLKRIYDQTGNQYYSSLDASGQRRDVPFKELANAGSVAQLQELVTIYNFHLQVVRDETGINEQAEGQTAKPRTTVTAVQTAISYSENATDYMNDACLSVKQETARKIACLIHDSVEFESKEYSQIMGTEFAKDRVYDVNIEIVDSDEDISMLLAEVNQFVSASPEFIKFIDPIKLKIIAEDSLELASIYFRRMQMKALQGQQQQTQQQANMNAQAQAQSAQVAAQAQQETDAKKSSYEVAIAKERQKELVITGIFSIYSKGLPIPPELKAMEGELITNILLPLFSENINLQQQAREQQDPTQQQGQEQENPQDNMQEQGQEEPQPQDPNMQQ